MAFETVWYTTNVPIDVVDILEKDIQKFDSESQESKLSGNILDKDIRNSTNVWVPTSHWIGGFLWHYIQRANRENFLYDLTAIDGENIQYTQYGPGQFYNWHIDGGIANCYKPDILPGSGVNLAQDQITVNGESVRKLSFVLQLSDPSEYTGGELQFMGTAGQLYFAPKQRGTIITFDSRVKHRVRKVKSGLRKSLVGWVVGPRWK